MTDLTVQKRAEEELRKAHHGLEIRVQERTRELVSANQALQSEISERKRAEEALRLSEERWATTLASIGDAVIATDVVGRITFMNTVAEDLTGWQLREANQKPIPEVFRIINEHTRQTVEDPVAKVIKAGSIVGLADHTILVRKDGTEVAIDDSGAPIRDKDGKVMGVVLVFRDINKRREAERQILRSREELEIRVQERTAELAGANKELREEISKRERAEQQLRQAQKMEAIGTFAGGIAHDLNNILSPVVINSELALLDLPGESGIRESLELILQSGMRGKDLVKQLLLFSRKSEKKQEIVVLTPMIKDTFKLLRASISKTIQIKLQLETETDTVFADPTQIQQVIMNLCTNAAYAMRGRTGSIEICVQGITFGSDDLPESEMKAGDYLVLAIKDSGCGMDEEIRKRIFEPFFTTKPLGEGTGLGLSVVFGIVKDHMGHITVYSEPGKGSIFKIYLPKLDTGTSAEAEAFKPIPGGSERILFVDDEEIIANSVRKMLQRLGYQVAALMDSREALKLFSQDPSQFDLVIADQTMPFMTGKDLGREVMRLRPDIPVILCTGYGDLISSEKAAAMGFKGFIMKPFTVREGAEIVRRVLDQKETN